MAKRKMKESMDNITNIKNSTAALSPEMQLAKEKAKDKDEEFEKIVLGKDVVLGASKQPTPDKPKWSLDESLFDKPISFEFDESLKESFYWLSDSRINILKRLGYSSKEDLAFAENLCEEEGLDLEEIVNTLDDIYKNGKEKAEAFYRDFFVDEDGNPIEIDESLNEDKKITRYSDVLPQKDRDRGWWYFTTHGVGPGTIPKDLNVLEVRDGQNKRGTWGTFVRLDGIVNTSELSYYDLTELAPPNAKNESLNDLNEETTNPYGKAIPYQVSDELWRVRLSNRYKDLTEYDVWGYGSTTKPKDFYSEIAAEDAAAEYNQRYEDIEDELDESLNRNARKSLNELLSDSSFAEPSIIVIRAGGPQNYSKQRLNSYIMNIVNNCTFKPEILYDAEDTVTVTIPGRQDWVNKLSDMYEESAESNIIIDLGESLRKDKNMKRYIIEEMNDEITDIDAYNESRDAKLVKRYKSILGLDEDFEITEENLDEWALKHACSLEGANYDRAKAAVLGLKFEGYK